MYMEKVKIVEASKLEDFKSINEYLLHTYGKKKLEQSQTHNSPTFLDVIGYTLSDRIRDGFSYETLESKVYELDEIEELMQNSPSEKDRGK